MKIRTGLVGHEIGHAMGLSHQPNKQNSSIMYNYDDRYILSDNGNTAIERNKPAKVDCNNINHIYI
ncbi:matrixin family metalloprotease [uncultured Eubacterium sp.]|uniref:matrixin family metalloprotease n=1 Tax=Eubacterium sp. TaxID=142586 RepID=UPI003264A675